MDKTKNPNTPHQKLRLEADHLFQFKCMPGISCYTNCCRDVTIALTPYDVLRLKKALKIPSDVFLDKYTITLSKKDRLIPMLILKMNEQDKKCPFVSEKGCVVYEDRPWPCRMYPLNVNDDGTYSIIADSSLCKGLSEDNKWQISQWLIDQGIPVYDDMIELFSEVTSPLRAQDLDIDNPQIFQMVFMSLYNLDKFRDFVFKSTFLERFEVENEIIEKIKTNDLELLKFAFDWIKFGILGKKLFQVKEDALPKKAVK